MAQLLALQALADEGVEDIGLLYVVSEETDHSGMIKANELGAAVLSSSSSLLLLLLGLADKCMTIHIKPAPTREARNRAVVP